MTRQKRKRLTITALAGILLTLMVVAWESAGWLEGIERRLYDLRAARCQFFLKPPSNRIVHVDIDDNSLRTMADTIDPYAPVRQVLGGWPWPRAVIGEMVSELRLAGAKVIVLDSIFSEPGRMTMTPGQGGKFTPINHDDRLASSVADAGNVLLPVMFDFTKPMESPLMAAVKTILTQDVELSRQEVMEKLEGKGFKVLSHDMEFAPALATARKELIRQKIKALLEQEDLDVPTLEAKIAPKTSDQQYSPINEIIEEQYTEVRRLLELRRFERPLMSSLPPLLPSYNVYSPVLRLAQSMNYCGFADYLGYSDKVVRSIPLFVTHDGRMFPHLTLVTACAMLGCDINSVQIKSDEIVIPASPQAIHIPVRTIDSPNHGEVGLVMDIPWFGGSDSLFMYDYPAHKKPAQHIAALAVWDIRQLDHRLATNRKILRTELPDVKFPDDPEEFDKAVEKLPATDVLQNYRKITAGIQRDLARDRAELTAAVKDKAVFMGWVATGISADFVPTSLDGHCPGVFGHSTILNGILTGEMWRTLPHRWTLIATITVGIVASAVMMAFSPWASLFILLLLAGAYSAFNGIYLFDYHNLILGLTAPLLTIVLIFPVVSTMAFIFESADRNFVTRRFSRYTDPALLNYIMEHPEKAHLEPEVHELTVCFTDLVGFTAMTERIGPQAIDILNEYMSEMAPIIRKHRGYVNKFLGDGIMFFCGAPVENANHARDTAEAVLEMQEEMERFNEMQMSKGLPALAFRAGVSTGKMLVGDAGPDEGADYTVLGDAVNLGARLESANRYFGTRTLINERAAEVLREKYLLRPIGKLRFYGKSEGAMVYELVARLDKANEDQRQLVKLTEEVVTAYLNGQIEKCLEAIEFMEATIGPRTLTNLYRELCDRQIKSAGAEAFDPQIALSDK